MFYAIKSFLSQITVALLDSDKKPFTFYTIRTEDVNLSDIYVGQITQKMPELKAFFADIGNGRSVYLSSKQPLEIGQRINICIIKEPRLGKIAEGKRKGNVLQPQTPVGLVQKGDFLAGIPDTEDYQQLEWFDELDDAINESSDIFVSFADGARLIFERTHAFHSIDVDSHTSLLPMDKINQIAAKIIGSEIIKRNLSGNIIIDFIGQKRKSDVGELKNIMSRELFKSPVQYQIMGISPMGNLELRRKRLRASFADSSKTTSSTAFKMFEEIVKNPTDISSVRVSLTLYAHLTSILQNTWNQVQMKTGDKIRLIADTQTDTFNIEYKK
ncbi:MAG: hypothetical protein E7013_04015 [Alphaproteobacteria bacterium]|nr:hypothetical protein [Alphaproteobacteria bacterium]